VYFALLAYPARRTTAPAAIDIRFHFVLVSVSAEIASHKHLDKNVRLDEWLWIGSVSTAVHVLMHCELLGAEVSHEAGHVLLLVLVDVQIVGPYVRHLVGSITHTDDNIQCFLGIWPRGDEPPPSQEICLESTPSEVRNNNTDFVGLNGIVTVAIQSGGFRRPKRDRLVSA
jgi:hypothetical protein